MVSAGDEQKPLSLDSPGFKRIAGVINYIKHVNIKRNKKNKITQNVKQKSKFFTTEKKTESKLN